MKPVLPPPVKRYLETVSGSTRKMAYLRLDSNLHVDLSGGHLKQCEVDCLDFGCPINEQIDSLVGLLPIRHLPVVIENAKQGESRYLDLHLFTEDGRQWIVLFDNTEAAVELQAKQQKQLISDIHKERKY